MKGFKKIDNPNLETNKLQDNVESVFKSISKSLILNGVLLSDIEVSADAKEISHKLGRPLLGYIIVKSDSDVRVWDEQSTNKRSELTLILRGSGSATISLWCF